MLIKVIIDRFEGDKAVLIADDKQSLIWPKNKLPQKSKEGSSLRIAISLDSEKREADQELAKDILNEILNTGEEE